MDYKLLYIQKSYCVEFWFVTTLWMVVDCVSVELLAVLYVRTWNFSSNKHLILRYCRYWRYCRYCRCCRYCRYRCASVWFSRGTGGTGGSAGGCPAMGAGRHMGTGHCTLSRATTIGRATAASSWAGNVKWDLTPDTPMKLSWPWSFPQQEVQLCSQT